ncbi:MAG: transposase [Candidatus Eremiobacteraeota bacterium]|nr:transposase [Candidatus Eremiobacteraeota bacterium]
MQKGHKNEKEVESKPTRAAVKTFGAVTVSENPKFNFRFAKVFNSFNFIKFLEQLVHRYPYRMIHLILDNARYHHARLVRKCLKKNCRRIELHYLPPYSPDLNASEGVWRLSRRESTHNRYFGE